MPLQSRIWIGRTLFKGENKVSGSFLQWKLPFIYTIFFLNHETKPIL